MILYTLSRDDLINFALELQQKLIMYSKDMEDQLIYVAELEEGVRTLAEKVDAQSVIIKSQTEQITHLIAEKEGLIADWKEKCDMMAKVHDQDSKEFLQRIAVLEEENATYDQLIGEMEDVINSQESKILDLLVGRESIRNEEKIKSDDDADRTQYENNNAMDLSLLSNNSDDRHESDIDEEEISPADLKISRDLSVRMGQIRRRESRLIDSQSDLTASPENFNNSFSANKMFKPVNVVEKREPESLILASMRRDIINDRNYNDHIPAPPMPPPSPLSKIGRNSFSRLKESPPLPQPPDNNTSWKDGKKQHDNLFQPVVSTNSNKEKSNSSRQQYFQWYEGDD